MDVGILGASGYMGGEALRVVLEHPHLSLAWATSRGGGDAALHHPNLHGLGVELTPPEETAPCDAVLNALPTAAGIDAVANQVDAGARVVDLGAAFRLRERATWERVYGLEHPRWDLADEAVYGLSELRLDAVRDARLVANPGCFSSAAILGLAPLVREGWIETERIVVDGLSGTAGAGAELDRALHHPEIGEGLVAYNVVGHRHTFEMEQELGGLVSGTGGVRVHFTPIYVPIVRGVLCVCHAFARRELDRARLLELYREFYAGAPFVQAFDLPPEQGGAWRARPYPPVRAVAGTNRCLIGLDVDPDRGRVVALSVLDSLGKGGAHAGIENLNLMLGLDRCAGLDQLGLHP